MTSVGSIGNLPGATINSSTGVFTDVPGTVIDNNNKLLSKMIVSTIAPSTVNITETLRIPRSVLYKASKLGLTQLLYRRTFSDCPAPSPSTACNTLAPISITFNLTGTTAGSFGISSYKLRFENDKTNQTIMPLDKLKAVAHIEATRTGTIKAVWEVATPSSTSGKPGYRVLRTEQRTLTSFAVNKIVSPVLPTDSTGIYLLRFRFLDPALEGDIPTIRYYVNSVAGKVLKPIRSLNPENNAKLSLQTRFEWESIPGANTYKLEFIEPPAGKDLDSKIEKYTPVTGFLLKAKRTEVKINKVILTYLKPGKTYWWHIIGLDIDGNATGTSPWRLIQN